jgi:FtsH-binding integral membrane protein
MDMQQFPTTTTLSAEDAAEIQRSFVLRTFAWMAGGLAISSVTAMLTVSTPGARQLVFGTPMVFFGLIISQFGLVIWLSARVMKMSALLATNVFIGYAALTGITLSSVVLMYTAASVTTTFIAAAGMFGATATYGLVTKRDLTSMGSFLFMGLIGLVIASVINMIWANDTMYWLITYLGIIIFTGLAAWDTQKIKKMSVMALEGGETEQKGAIIGALMLYLDFINLFLMLLRLLGRRR